MRASTTEVPVPSHLYVDVVGFIAERLRGDAVARRGSGSHNAPPVDAGNPDSDGAFWGRIRQTVCYLVLLEWVARVDNYGASVVG